MESAKRPNTAKQPYTTLPRICMTSVCDNCELRSLSRRWCSRVGEGRCSSCCNTFSSHCYICAASASPALRACVERVHLSETRNRLSTSYIGTLLHTLTPYHRPDPSRRFASPITIPSVSFIISQSPLTSKLKRPQAPGASSWSKTLKNQLSQSVPFCFRPNSQLNWLRAAKMCVRRLAPCSSSFTLRRSLA
jgi:hypothetical protein